MAKVNTKKKTVKKAKPGLKAKPKSGSKIKLKSVKTAKSAARPKIISGSAKSVSKNTKPGSVTVKKSPAKKKISAHSKVKVPVKKAAEITAEKKVKKFKPNKKIKYTASELKHFREIILKERKAIIESAKANMEALVDKESGEYKGDNLTYSSHMAEQGTDEMEREKNYMFVQRDEKYLGYLQDALIRIDQGTYGICVDCKEHPKNLCRTCPLIQKERLELVPITQHCIECKNLK